MQTLSAAVNEAELLASWRAGDRAAGQALFRASYRLVARYFRNKVPGAVHADLVQKTFDACVRSADRFLGRAQFRTYLLRIAHHVLVDHIRAARRSSARAPDVEIDIDDVVVADSFSDPDAIATRRQDHRILLGALRRLPLAQQEVLELRYWEAMSDREIAEAIGAPVGTVKTRLRGGLERLQREVARAEVAPELLRSTIDTLERWSERVRQGLGVLEHE